MTYKKQKRFNVETVKQEARH